MTGVWKIGGESETVKELIPVLWALALKPEKIEVKSDGAPSLLGGGRQDQSKTPQAHAKQCTLLNATNRPIYPRC